jgi:hypothetical protein
VVLALTLFAAAATAAEVPAGTRPQLDLNGTWEFRLDRADEEARQLSR